MKKYLSENNKSNILVNHEVIYMNEDLIRNESNIIFYEDSNENSKIEVVLKEDNVWLNTNAIANLFNVQRSAIVKHINNIYKDEELDKNSTCSMLEQVQKEGNRKVSGEKRLL